MDHGPLWRLIPWFYVTESSHGDRTCAASALLCISLEFKRHIELVNTRKSHDSLLWNCVDCNLERCSGSFHFLDVLLAAKLPSITVSWPAGLEVIGTWQCFQQLFFIKSNAKLAFAIKPVKQHCLSLSMLMALLLIALTDLPINAVWGLELSFHGPGLQSCVGSNGSKWRVV